MEFPTLLWSGIDVFAVGKDKPLISIEEPSLAINYHEQCVSLTSDHRFITALLDDGKVRLWDVKTGLIVTTYKAPVGAFCRAAISPDGKTLVGVCTPDGKIFNPKVSETFLVLPALQWVNFGYFCPRRA